MVIRRCIKPPKKAGIDGPVIPTVARHYNCIIFLKHTQESSVDFEENAKAIFCCLIVGPD